MDTVADGASSDGVTGSAGVTGSSAGVVAHVVAGAVTFPVSGEIPPGFMNTIDEAFTQAASAQTAPTPAMVVDLTEVTFLSLEGAAELVMLARRCIDQGRDLRVKPSPSVRRKLALAGLDTLIPLVEL
ncbi:STAS domain-containing protein [Actinokineospora sp. NPDC004072]